MFLSEKEIRKITRKTQGAAQARALMLAGISFQMVSGHPVVPKAQFQQTAKPFEPELKLVRA